MFLGVLARQFQSGLRLPGVVLQTGEVRLGHARIADRFEIRFHILGDGPDGAVVEEEVRQRAMENVVLDRRFVSRRELEENLASADAVLGVFGSTAKTGRVVPCKVYDGLAAGLPVVTGDGAGPRELLTHGENALLVDRSDEGIDKNVKSVIYD